MVIHNFKIQVLVTWPATNFLILSKWCGFEKLNHYYFVLRDDPLTVFRRQNRVTFIFIKTMSHDLLVQVAYWVGKCGSRPKTQPFAYLWPISAIFSTPFMTWQKIRYPFYGPTLKQYAISDLALARLLKRVVNAIHRISVVCSVNTCPLDSDISDG